MPRTSGITLYLTEWQKRMVNDNIKTKFRAKNFNKIYIPKIPKIEWVTYRVPVFEDLKAGAWNLYLTDEQIAQVTEIAGIKTKFSALTVTSAMLEAKAVVFQ